MDSVVRWVKLGLKWALVAIGVLISCLVLMVWTSDPVKPKPPVRFKQENLFKEDSILHFVSEQLSLIAPGQLIYLVHREEGRPAFPAELKDPDREDLRFYLSDKYRWGGPGHSEGGILNGYVQSSLVNKINLCAINLNPTNLDKSAGLRNLGVQRHRFMVITHETIHCGQAAALHKMENRFNAVINRLIDEQDFVGNREKLLGLSSIVFMESFVGAYYLTNAQQPGQSVLLDEISLDGWKSELKESKWRGYAGSFAAIAKRCAKPGDCSANLEQLNAQLSSDPAVMRAVVMDAIAITKKSPNFARAK
ncbi:hypothetical protein F3I62_19005 [Pseudomonas sp. R-28-1W-6]|uniref:hypothetical protein n=1 Tax=Pseudomonas sp. R-28-1W-6 TaxID=2650101 RepID=UPI00136630B1|nr:hypothetical protein [Pseudomonas sp. R-28-1W-6]MWV14195.1 hypothetical protein [Pseudomonas sp. R-28-1W-6]